MTQPFISAICCTAGRVAHLRQAVACFEAQDYEGPHELLIVNSFPAQTLICDVPNVRVINLKQRPKSLGALRNLAVREAAGTHCVVCDDDDLEAPHHLRLFAEAFGETGADWVRVNPVYYAEGWKIRKAFTTWANAVAFSKEAWERIGGYSGDLTVGEDRALWSKLSEQCRGVTVELKPEEVSAIYCWGNPLKDSPVYHVSGLGADVPGRAPAWERARLAVEQRVRARLEPVGRIVIEPEMQHDPVAMISEFIDRDRISTRKSEVCIVELGKAGDIINLLPVALYIHNTVGKPHFMVSHEYADVLDGVTYVTPYVTRYRHNKLHQAIAEAKRLFGTVMVGQIWGENWEQERLCGSYNEESWRMCGLLPKFSDPTWRPIFDNQNRARAELAFRKARLSAKPLLLCNLTKGTSSPFPEGPAVMSAIHEKWGERCEILEVGPQRLDRIYDLLPFIEAATAVITIDTSLLHLSAVTNTPVIALCNPNPWTGSAMRCAVAARLTYDDVRNDVGVLQQAIERVLNGQTIEVTSPERWMRPEMAPIGRRIYHVVAPYDGPTESERRRKEWARKSWDRLYANGVIPCHYTTWQRYAAHKTGKSQLPYLKDILEFGMRKAEDLDIVCYTNDDIICHPALQDRLLFHCAAYGCAASQRCEIAFAPPPSLDATVLEWAAASQNKHIHHYGRDTFAFTKKWLVDHWDEIPDFITGSPEWDNVMTFMFRRDMGYEPTMQSLKRTIWPAEMEQGLTAHIFHRSNWQSPQNHDTSPPNVHNRKLFCEWAKTHAPNLKFNAGCHLIG